MATRDAAGDQRALEVVDWSEGEENDGVPAEPLPSCPICLTDILDPLEKAVTGCLHTFCKTCLTEWLRVKRFCPLCKRRIHTYLTQIRDDADFKEVEVPPSPVHDYQHYHHHQRQYQHQHNRYYYDARSGGWITRQERPGDAEEQLQRIADRMTDTDAPYDPDYRQTRGAPRFRRAAAGAASDGGEGGGGVTIIAARSQRQQHSAETQRQPRPYFLRLQQRLAATTAATAGGASWGSGVRRSDPWDAAAAAAAAYTGPTGLVVVAAPARPAAADAVRHNLRAVDEQAAAVAARRRMYELGLQSAGVVGGTAASASATAGGGRTAGVRDGRNCPATTSAVVAAASREEERRLQLDRWVARELQALLGFTDVSLLRALVTGLVERYGVERDWPAEEEQQQRQVVSGASGSGRSSGGGGGGPSSEEGPVAALRPFLFERAAHFWHELRCFVMSGLPVKAYDARVQYRQDIGGAAGGTAAAAAAAAVAARPLEPLPRRRALLTGAPLALSLAPTSATATATASGAAATAGARSQVARVRMSPAAGAQPPQAQQQQRMGVKRRRLVATTGAGAVAAAAAAATAAVSVGRRVEVVDLTLESGGSSSSGVSIISGGADDDAEVGGRQRRRRSARSTAIASRAADADRGCGDDRVSGDGGGVSGSRYGTGGSRGGAMFLGSYNNAAAGNPERSVRSRWDVVTGSGAAAATLPAPTPAADTNVVAAGVGAGKVAAADTAGRPAPRRHRWDQRPQDFLTPGPDSRALKPARCENAAACNLSVAVRAKVADPAGVAATEPGWAEAPRTGASDVAAVHGGTAMAAAAAAAAAAAVGPPAPSASSARPGAHAAHCRVPGGGDGSPGRVCDGVVGGRSREGRLEVREQAVDMVCGGRGTCGSRAASKRCRRSGNSDGYRSSRGRSGGRSSSSGSSKGGGRSPSCGRHAGRGRTRGNGGAHWERYGLHDSEDESSRRHRHSHERRRRSRSPTVLAEDQGRQQQQQQRHVRQHRGYGVTDGEHEFGASKAATWGRTHGADSHHRDRHHCSRSRSRDPRGGRRHCGRDNDSNGAPQGPSSSCSSQHRSYDAGPDRHDWPVPIRNCGDEGSGGRRRQRQRGELRSPLPVGRLRGSTRVGEAEAGGAGSRKSRPITAEEDRWQLEMPAELQLLTGQR